MTDDVDAATRRQWRADVEWTMRELQSYRPHRARIVEILNRRPWAQLGADERWREAGAAILAYTDTETPQCNDAGHPLNGYTSLGSLSVLLAHIERLDASTSPARRASLRELVKAVREWPAAVGRAVEFFIEREPEVEARFAPSQEAR
jgi:hypothetical protein